ncbi:N-acetyltransferase [Actinoplanes cyaneus]|uniref:N-acetyltransferase n=1 Tax=Actinoplanes cyaneus TaxID=52696 RepID=A0A919M874_9ACTN|nr:GNAT family N-acetyltransferase [Actinoplanes cyaneus]MCW2143031.1 Acetyltransferase (GNAT) family protein [Actinoplanes cyaneus]GID69532.1 N-acetyltransferase [Actinoplanes cyaneus]
MPSWIMTVEPVCSPDAYALRRDYYVEVAGRYLGRPATASEVDEGLAGDGAELLVPPTGQFVIGRWAGRPAACGGFLLLGAGRAELTRVYVAPDARRGGARLLLAALEELAAAMGATEMVLNTRLDLVEARALYSRSGYAEIPAYCTGPYNEVWYGRSIVSR